jgi:diguanylate cyclase (GGDEF)-like protein
MSRPEQIAMSESQATQHDAARDSTPDRAARVKSRPWSRWSTLAVVAILCLAAGVAASLLGAHAVAHHKAAKTQREFKQASTEIAATLKQNLQRQEGLAIGASTFFAGTPKASPAEFDAWAQWSHVLGRHPELANLGLVALVRAPELAATELRIAGRTVTSASAAATPPRRDLRISPAGNRSYYCLSVAAVARNAASRPSAGTDYCATSPALLSSRDSGLRSYARASAAGVKALVMQMPVYRGAARPATKAGRRAAFAGWLREVLTPATMLQGALGSHLGDTVQLHYRSRTSNVAFTSGVPRAGAQSNAINLHNGWTVRVFGPRPNTSVLADGQALALLIAGCLLSVLLSLLILIRGVRGKRPQAPASEELPQQLYDTLTGLPNRELTLDLAERMVARAKRQSGMLAGALLIDIDWFSDVNDKLGQAYGDQLLSIVAQRLESVVRTGDTVGRLGGDRFVVLVESQARGIRLDSLARRVIEALHKPIALEDFGPSFSLTASIGVAFGRYTAPEDLLRDAQLATQSAKSAGKDRYTLFNANMRSTSDDTGVLEVDLNTALQEGQFFLLYQPIYDLCTHRIASFEALIRWRHPTRGVLAPADFIPLAEESGLIVPIGRWVLQEACSRAAAWQVAGRQVGVSAMVSTNQLNRDGFATDVRRALQQSGIEPSQLTLEIAETTVMLDPEAAAGRLHEIKQLGVCIAIDDFGSGYAYRSDLQRMPLDFLKVDRSSLAASDDEDYRSWLLEAILHFGRDLSLTVIAKGIETRQQMTTVQAMGCTLAQGFFLGEPIPADTVEGLLDADVSTAPLASAASSPAG